MPVMASPPTPTAYMGPAPAPESQTPPQSIHCSQPRGPNRRPLRREGACYFLSAVEQDDMLRSSPTPEPVLGKRTHRVDNLTLEDHNDTEHDEGPPLTTSLDSFNHVVATFRLKKKLRPEQCDELDAFLSDTALGQQAKLFTRIMSLENKVNALQSGAPSYHLSDELKNNINDCGLAVILSVNISAYTGNIPRNHVLDILKRYPSHFDLPEGIKNVYANWEKISTFVSYSLMHACARVKNLIKDGIESNMNIFPLARNIVHSTPCRTTFQLCARVALLRAIYVECSGNEKYWNLVDARLESIRSKAGSSAFKTTREFNKFLKVDRAKYGVGENYVIEDTVTDEWQRCVDDVVAEQS